MSEIMHAKNCEKFLATFGLDTNIERFKLVASHAETVVLVDGKKYRVLELSGHENYPTLQKLLAALGIPKVMKTISRVSVTIAQDEIVGVDVELGASLPQIELGPYTLERVQ